jgi:hypothetical protein
VPPALASLDNPRAKLDRAYEHLESLDREIAAFFETEPYVIEPEFRAKTGEHVFRVRIRRNPPLRLGTLVGDFATNTRAALDHLVWQLVVLTGERPNRSTAFPVCQTASDWRRDVERRLGTVDPRHRAIIERAQPYMAGSDAEHTVLTLLSWLVNHDKHRVVHATYAYIPTPEALYFTFRTPGGVQVASTYDQIAIAKGRRVVDGADIARVKLPDPTLQVEMHGEITFDIAFGERWMRATALAQIHEWVRHFVETFASDFPPP